jgi:Rad3-related DNA helicase
MKRFLTILAAAGLAIALAGGDDAWSASKKSAKRSDYTKAQQKAFYDEALKICRKKFGAQLHEVKVDYSRNRYVCYHY